MGIVVSNIIMRLCVALCSLCLSSVAVYSQGGIVVGKITDGESGEPLRGATVQVVEAKKGGYTDTKGEYRIKNVTPGTYTMRFTFVGYDPKVVEKLVVRADETVTLNIVLTASAASSEEVVVEAERVNDNAAAVLAQRKEAATVSDGISKEEISKLSDSDAGQSIKRVTGVTLVDGKYVYVRGVSDRYSNTTLNGSSLSTTEPDKKSFAFDMFPSELLENVNVTKSFTPDLPGNFVGGLVQMNTIDFPQGFSVRVNAGFAGNDFITMRDGQFLGYQAGPTDWLGIDGGYRAAPDVPSTPEFAAMRSQVNAGNDEATEQWIGIGTGFNNELLETRRTTAPFAGKGGISLTNVWDIKDESRIGLVASVNYGNNYGVNRILRRGIQSDGTSLLFDYAGQTTTSSTNVNFLGNVAYKLGSSTTVSWKNTYAINSDDEGVYQYGTELTQSQLRKNVSFEFQEKRLYATALSGEHNIPVASNLLIDWKVGYSQSQRNQPDLRRFRYQKDLFADESQPLEIMIQNTGVTTQGLGSNAGRFYSDLNEYARNINLNGTLSLSAVKVKVGGLHESKNRDFTSRSYTYIQDQESTIDYSQLTYTQDPSVVPNPIALFADSNFRADRLGISEDSRLRDSYVANELLWAGYAMVDIPFTLAGLETRVIAGARVESSSQNLDSYNDQDQPVNVNLDITDILPSLNIVVSPWKNFNFRAAATQTLTRPSLREFAPFAFFDFQTQSTTRGNPELTRALVQNYDFRAEWFPGPGEVVSASIFYKNFINAIEETVDPSTSELIRSFRNASQPATNYGIELEARKNLGFIAPALQFFVVGANVAIINSNITVKQGTVDDNRRMWGQSPYTVNANLSYFNPDWGTGITVGYNIAGRKIIQVAQIGVYQIKDEYKEDGPHIYENPRDVIDISVTQAIGNLEFRGSVRDILNQALVWEQLGQVVASNIRGVSYSLGVSYKFN